MTTHSGKPSMPSAWSAQVHGKVLPMDHRDGMFSLWSDLIDQRPADEPHPLLGAIIASALLGILIACGTLFAVAVDAL